MADMIPVFSPDVQITDSNGDPVAGGSLTFYNAGTTDARVVYSDPGPTTSLGNVVTLNADGRPVSGASLVTIYTGTTAYKFVVKDSDGATLRTHDNLPGAFDTSALAEIGDVTGLGTGYVATQTISADDTAVDGDEGHVFNVNPSGGSRTLTLPSATTAGDAWPITVRHDGTSNSVLIATVGGDVIQHAGTDVETLPLLQRGDSATLVSDGATSWMVTHYSPGLISNLTPVLTVESITATPPGSPTPGQTYILDSTPSGAWSAQAQHDVARWTGGEWIYWTPPTDSGWIAYDKNTNTNYQFQASAWVVLVGTVGTGLLQTAGVLSVVFADAADMEAATETDEAVTPVLQHRHPGHPKAWVVYDADTTNTPVLQTDYGVLSLTDTGTGDTLVTFDTAFSTDEYAVSGFCRFNSSSPAGLVTQRDADGLTTTDCDIITASSSGGALFDSIFVSVIFAGDQ